MSRRHPDLAFVLALGLLLVAQFAVAAEPLDPRVEAAITLYREEGAEKALPVFEGLAREFSQASRPRDHAAATHYIGECHWRLGNFADARTHLDRALAMEGAAGDRLAEGKTLKGLETIHAHHTPRRIERHLGNHGFGRPGSHTAL